jgi:(2Fe-2S) ferredoxin
VLHLFVCTNEIASGKPACGRRGARAFVTAIQSELIARRVTARVTPCGCLGPCFDGPNAVVYGDQGGAGVWYGDLTTEDAPAIVEHLAHGVIHTTKRIAPPGDEPLDADAPT